MKNSPPSPLQGGLNDQMYSLCAEENRDYPEAGISLPPAPARRRFVAGLAAGGVLAALPIPLLAQGPGATGSPPVLNGPQIDLEIAESRVNFTGAERTAITINGSIPAPTLRFREGDEVSIRVNNRLSVPTSIHWHGIILPFDMDGVPGISFRGIAPGETFIYRFRLQQSGTYWYHSHTGFQEMKGMYGALVIEPLEGEADRYDKDYVVQLSDWTDEDPMRVLGKLKTQSDVFNFNQPTLGGLARDVSGMGLQAALEKRQMWNVMRMNPTDLADLSSATLTYLMNGTTPAGNWTGLFSPGDKVRLRFINAASNTFYDVRIPGLKMRVIQADGQNIVPVSVDEFRFGPGETYDVLVEPTGEAHTLFAQSMDRTGYARGTLAVRAGLETEVPALDAVEWLAMSDMMGNMNHGEMDETPMNHVSMDEGAMSNTSAGIDSMTRVSPDSSAMNHADMPVQPIAQGQEGLDHSGMSHSSMAMDHSQHASTVNPLRKPNPAVRHASSEYGSSVDMRVDRPRTSLDDPGVGLRNNGRRVLTMADLRSREGVLDDRRVPEQEIELHLTGNMERYSWSFDGLEFGASTPVFLPHYQRIRVILQNDTMMTHPMHLHGMWSDLESAEGELLVRRHTIPVQPAQRISFLTTPHDLGRWAWHCHLLFHMDAGMFREVVVA